MHVVEVLYDVASCVALGRLLYTGKSRFHFHARLACGMGGFFFCSLAWQVFVIGEWVWPKKTVYIFQAENLQ